MRDPHVFQQLPRSMGRALRLHTLKLGRKISEGFFPRYVGMAAIEKVAKLLADNFFAA